MQQLSLKNLNVNVRYNNNASAQLNDYIQAFNTLHLVHNSPSNSKISKLMVSYFITSAIVFSFTGLVKPSYGFTRCRNKIFTFKDKKWYWIFRTRHLYPYDVYTLFSVEPQLQTPCKQVGMWCERIRHLNQYRPILKLADWLKKMTQPSQDLRVIAIWWLTLLGRLHRCSRLPNVFQRISRKCHSYPRCLYLCDETPVNDFFLYMTSFLLTTECFIKAINC